MFEIQLLFGCHINYDESSSASSEGFHHFFATEVFISASIAVLFWFLLMSCRFIDATIYGRPYGEVHITSSIHNDH